MLVCAGESMAEALVQVRLRVVAKGEAWLMAVVEEVVEEGGFPVVEGVN